MNFKKDILLENSISKKSFGRTKRGDKISLFELKNVNGMEVHIINYGCTITSIQVPDRKGELKEVAFGHETIEGYEERNDYFGCIVGRVANRIGNATFTIDDKTYKLAKNDKSNGLHGGYAGFDKQLWDAEPFEELEATGVVLTYLSRDGEEGYPGELKCKVTYSLNNNNELRIEYHGITSKKTVLNLTNHTYFNLLDGGATSILNHKLQINASYYTPIDDRLITTGEIAPVVNTPFDFRKPKTIGKEIEDENKQLKNGLGYDHNFILDKEDDILDLVATVVEPSSGLTLEVYTTEPGLQLYSGNFLKGDIKGKKGVIYKHRNGFCLETQHFPDSPNKPQFPSIELNPGEDFKSITIYRFR